MDLIFPHRLARLSYFLRNVALVAVGALLAPSFGGEGSGAMILVAVLVLLYWAVFIVAPRCRDTGLSPWLGLLVMVPGVNIFIGGYLTWKRSWPSTDGLDVRRPSAMSAPDSRPGKTAETEKSDSLRRLEALRNEGVLTETDFQRRKARLGRDTKTRD